MQFECKFNGTPVGLIETDGEIPNGISELTFDFYRSIAHLEMYKQLKIGIPTFIEIEIAGNTINLKLLEHNGNSIKAELL